MIKDFEYVRQAYGILDPEVLGSSREKTAKDIENFSQNLYIECAEKAIGVIQTVFIIVYLEY